MIDAGDEIVLYELQTASISTELSSYRWSLKFGAAFARSLRRKKARPGDIWHLDEVRIVIRDQPHWLWRAVDQDGYVLDEIMQTRKQQGVS